MAVRPPDQEGHHMRITALAIAAAIASISTASADTSARSMGVKAPKADRIVLSTQSAGRQGGEAVPGTGEGRPQLGAAPLFTAAAPATTPAPRTRGLAPERTKLSFRMPWVTGVFQ